MWHPHLMPLPISGPISKSSDQNICSRRPQPIEPNEEFAAGREYQFVFPPLDGPQRLAGNSFSRHGTAFFPIDVGGVFDYAIKELALSCAWTD
jgi:hypothetical protein